MHDLRRLDVREPWLRQLILDKFNTTHLYQGMDISQEQALFIVEYNVEHGLEWYFGSQSEQFVYRIVQSNPYVVEPHYLGCMKKLRTLQPKALEWLFANTNTQKIEAYTHLKSSVRIQSRYGYKVEGHLKNSYYEDGKLHDMFVLALHREDYYNNVQSISDHSGPIRSAL